MSMNFPDSPTIGDTFSIGIRAWTWDGTTWNGKTGPTTPGGDEGGGGPGATGPVGPKSMALELPQPGDSITIMYAFSTTSITRLALVLPNAIGGPSITFDLLAGSDRSNPTITLLSSQVVSSTTTATIFTVPSPSVPSGNFIWINVTNVTGTAPELSLTVEMT